MNTSIYIYMYIFQIPYDLTIFNLDLYVISYFVVEYWNNIENKLSLYTHVVEYISDILQLATTT